VERRLVGMATMAEFGTAAGGTTGSGITPNWQYWIGGLSERFLEWHLKQF